jgi:hypothetical protein
MEFQYKNLVIKIFVETSIGTSNENLSIGEVPKKVFEL